MALTAQQIVDVRRYCGYSVSGDTTSFNYRELVYSNVSYFGLTLDFRLAHLSAEEESVVVNTFLANLTLREQEIQAAAANLDTDLAAVWKHNKNEIGERTALYTQLRMELCTFLGFAPGPRLAGSNRISRA